ncbi:hypothetical protein RRG12_32070 [Nostoc sp. CALU 546]
MAASLVFLFKLMLKKLTITATLNYLFVLRLRRTIILCGSFAESENFHIAATPFLSPLLWLRQTRIYQLLDFIKFRLRR